jgi:hypothetical protein
MITFTCDDREMREERFSKISGKREPVSTTQENADNSYEK